MKMLKSTYLQVSLICVLLIGYVSSLEGTFSLRTYSGSWKQALEIKFLQYTYCKHKDVINTWYDFKKYNSINVVLKGQEFTLGSNETVQADGVISLGKTGIFFKITHCPKCGADIKQIPEQYIEYDKISKPNKYEALAAFEYLTIIDNVSYNCGLESLFEITNSYPEKKKKILEKMKKELDEDKLEDKIEEMNKLDKGYEEALRPYYCLKKPNSCKSDDKKFEHLDYDECIKKIHDNDNKDINKIIIKLVHKKIVEEEPYEYELGIANIVFTNLEETMFNLLFSKGFHIDYEDSIFNKPELDGKYAYIDGDVLYFGNGESKQNDESKDKNENLTDFFSNTPITCNINFPKADIFEVECKNGIANKIRA